MKLNHYVYKHKLYVINYKKSFLINITNDGICLHPFDSRNVLKRGLKYKIIRIAINIKVTYNEF